MATRPRTRQTVIRPVYEDFKAKSEWIQDQESDNLLIYLPGFMKENLKVTTEGKYVIRVRGERSVTANKWHRLVEDYKVPDYCNLKEIRAKFEGGILTLTVPKKTTMVAKGLKDEAKPTQKQDYIPSKAAPNEKDKAESIQDSSLRPQETRHSLPRATNPDVGSQTKLTPEVIDDKGKDKMYPEPPVTQNIISEEKPPSTSAEKSEGLAPQTMLSEERTQKGQDHREQRDKTRGSGVGNGNTEKPNIFEKDGKSNGSYLLDRIDNVIEKIAKKTKLDKDGADFVLTDTKENIEPKAKEKSKGSTLLDRVENVPEIVKESLKKHGAGFALVEKNEDVKGKDEKSSKSENDEKSRVPTLLDRVENVTTKIGEKLKQEKDGIGLALTNKNENVEPKANQTTTTTTNAIASAGSHLKLEKYKQSLKGLMELDEEKQLIVNVGVAMLVIVALGTYVVYRTRK